MSDTRRHRHIIRLAGPYLAESRADGVIEVQPAWPEGLGGVINRLAVSDAIEIVLASICERKRRAR